MNDDMPIIIVDDRNITPISRIPRRDTLSVRSDRETLPFGVVDRVTLSNAARRKYRQAQSAGHPHLLQQSLEPQRAITYDASAKLSKVPARRS